MEWMITYQDVRRNMCDAEKIFANDKVSARRIIEENEKRKLEGYSKDKREEKASSVQMDGGSETPKSHTSPTHTREQRAKLAGVSTGTIARYDTVMKSDNEELKQSMLSGDVKIGTEITNNIKSVSVQMDGELNDGCAQMDASKPQ